MTELIKVDEKRYAEPIILDNNIILPGQEETVRLSAGRLPSDNRLYIYAHVYRSVNPGPTVLMMGGVHGDEINGVMITRNMIEEKVFKKLNRGTVISVPLLNVFGFINFSREVPDGKDINRSFPGTMAGSLAARVARTLTKKLLPLVDCILDFHTGGSSRYNYPQIRYSKKDPIAEKLAMAFGAPYTVQKSFIPKSLRKVAADMGLPTIVYEAGESVRLDGFSISKGMQGAKQVLQFLGMLYFSDLVRSNKTLLFRKTGWIRANFSGIFVWSKQSGHKVTKGEPIGQIKDPFGMKVVNVHAIRDGYIIGHNNASVVNQGDALFHVGYNYESIDI